MVEEAIKKLNITTLISYSRKSRDKEGEGLEKHRDVLEDFAKGLGLPLVVKEEVQSSETLNRPVLNELREQIKNKQIKCLVVYRLDRLSRKTTDLERLLQEFKFYDLLLIEVHRNKVVNYNEMLQNKLEAVMNDLYQEGAKMVLSAGKKKAVALYGNHLGEPPLGYDYNRETKKLQPNDSAFIVQHIYELYLEGRSVHQIAIILNQLGYKTRKGQHFKGKGVWKTLTNDKYIGVQTYGKQEWFKDENGKKRVKDRAKEEWIIYQDAHEPIIDKEKFEKVHILLDKNRKVPVGARRRKHPFSNVIKCGKCGRFHTFTKVNGKVYLRTCTNIDYMTGKRCGNSAIPVVHVEDFIKTKIWLEVRPVIKTLQKRMAKDSEGAFNNKNESKLKELQKQRNQINIKIDNLLEIQLETGKNVRLIEKSEQLEEQLKIVSNKIQELQNNLPTEQRNWVDTFMELSEDIDNFMNNWEQGTYESRNFLIKKYIDHIVNINGEQLKIVYTEEIQELLLI